MKKLIVLAGLFLSLTSAQAVSVAIALTADSVCETFNGAGSCTAQAPIGLLGASTTSTFAGATAGLIVLGDNGQYSIDSDKAYSICDSDDDLLSDTEVKVKEVLLNDGVCQ